jgi:hypothetical protein
MNRSLIFSSDSNNSSGSFAALKNSSGSLKSSKGFASLSDYSKQANYAGPAPTSIILRPIVPHLRLKNSQIKVPENKSSSRVTSAVSVILPSHNKKSDLTPLSQSYLNLCLFIYLI